MLSVGLALFCLRYIIPEKHWSDKAVKSASGRSTYLAWMVFATLLPLGLLQLYHSISVSYYDARTLNLSETVPIRCSRMWMPGDIVFILGGAPVFISAPRIRHMQRNSTWIEGGSLYRDRYTVRPGLKHASRIF
jgi:nitric oxide reductase subunit B